MAATPRSDLARIVALALAETKAGSDALKDLNRASELKSWPRPGPLSAGPNKTWPTSRSGPAPTAAPKRSGCLGPGQCPSLSHRSKVGGGAQPSLARAPGGGQESAVVAGQLADAERRWRTHVAPELARLEAQVFEGQGAVGSLLAHQEAQAARWWPLAERGHALKRDVQRFAVGLTSYREGLDGKRTSAPKHVGGPLYPAPTATTAIDHDYGPGM